MAAAARLPATIGALYAIVGLAAGELPSGCGIDDNGDQTNCTAAKYGNGVCDAECNSAICGHDGSDCKCQYNYECPQDPIGHSCIDGLCQVDSTAVRCEYTQCATDDECAVTSSSCSKGHICAGTTCMFSCAGFCLDEYGEGWVPLGGTDGKPYACVGCTEQHRQEHETETPWIIAGSILAAIILIVALYVLVSCLAKRGSQGRPKTGLVSPITDEGDALNRQKSAESDAVSLPPLSKNKEGFNAPSPHPPGSRLLDPADSDSSASGADEIMYVAPGYQGNSYPPPESWIPPASRGMPPQGDSSVAAATAGAVQPQAVQPVVGGEQSAQQHAEADTGVVRPQSRKRESIRTNQPAPVTTATTSQ